MVERGVVLCQYEDNAINKLGEKKESSRWVKDEHEHKFS